MTAHALVFVAPPDNKPAYREALLMLGRVALDRKLPPPNVLSGWESAEWIYPALDDELRGQINDFAKTALEKFQRAGGR